MRNSFNKISSLKSINNPENQIFFWALTGNYDALLNALQNGTSVNIIDPVTTDSPLMIACRKGHTNIVKLCLDYGAKNDPHPEFGQTALHASIIEQKYDCAKVILEVAAISDADHIISNLSDPSGQTPLHVAAYVGSASLVELLLYHGSRIPSVDVQGQTSLHLCACSGNKICLAMLLDHGGDDIIDMPDHTGNTALHHASYHGRLECVKLLLETAANVLICNADGYTAYNIASSQGHHQIGLLLLEYREHYSSIPTSVPTPMKSILRQSFPSSSTTNTNSLNNDWNNNHNIETPQGKKKSQSAKHYSTGTYANGLSIPHPPHLKDDIATSNFDSNNNDDDEYNMRDNIVSLNIMPPLPPPSDNHILSSSNPNSKLSIQAPVNPIASMYGKNDGMDYIDSIGSFLPRPHTIGSPLLSASKGLRAKASPTCMINSPLTLLVSENDPVNLENGIGSGYKVISKPSLRRHLSDIVIPNDNDNLITSETSRGIKTYNKESINISTASTRLNQYSQSNDMIIQSNIDKDVVVPINSENIHYKNRINNRSVDPFSHLVTYNTSQPNSPKRNRSGLSINSIKIEAENSKLINTFDNYSNYDSNNHNNSEYDDNNYYQNKYSIDDSQGIIDYAEPIEEFTCVNIEWKVYYTEDNHIYYLDMKNEHSQWEDPRQFGLVYTDYENNISYTNSYTDFKPPKSPSPKTHDKGKFFGLNYHENSLDRTKDIKPTKFNWYDNDVVDDIIDNVNNVSLELHEENQINNNDNQNDLYHIMNMNTCNNKESRKQSTIEDSSSDSSSDDDILRTGQKTIRIRYANNAMFQSDMIDHAIIEPNNIIKSIVNDNVLESLPNNDLPNKSILHYNDDDDNNNNNNNNNKDILISQIENNLIDMKCNTLIQDTKLTNRDQMIFIQEISNNNSKTINNNCNNNDNNNANKNISNDIKLHNLSIANEERILDNGDSISLNATYIINKDDDIIEAPIHDSIHQLKDGLIDIMI